MTGDQTFQLQGDALATELTSHFYGKVIIIMTFIIPCFAIIFVLCSINFGVDNLH